MVEELLGPNITVPVEELPASTILPPYLPRLADEMLLAIQNFYRFEFIHRDIKPQKLVIRLTATLPSASSTVESPANISGRQDSTLAGAKWQARSGPQSTHPSESTMACRFQTCDRRRVPALLFEE
jgi:hypothetical protein